MASRSAKLDGSGIDLCTSSLGCIACGSCSKAMALGRSCESRRCLFLFLPLGHTNYLHLRSHNDDFVFQIARYDYFDQQFGDVPLLSETHFDALLHPMLLRAARLSNAAHLSRDSLSVHVTSPISPPGSPLPIVKAEQSPPTKPENPTAAEPYSAAISTDPISVVLRARIDVADATICGGAVCWAFWNVPGPVLERLVSSAWSVHSVQLSRAPSVASVSLRPYPTQRTLSSTLQETLYQGKQFVNRVVQHPMTEMLTAVGLHPADTPEIPAKQGSGGGKVVEEDSHFNSIQMQELPARIRSADLLQDLLSSCRSTAVYSSEQKFVPSSSSCAILHIISVFDLVILVQNWFWSSTGA